MLAPEPACNRRLLPSQPPAQRHAWAVSSLPFPTLRLCTAFLLLPRLRNLPRQYQQWQQRNLRPRRQVTRGLGWQFWTGKLSVPYIMLEFCQVEYSATFAEPSGTLSRVGQRCSQWRAVSARSSGRQKRKPIPILLPMCFLLLFIAFQVRIGHHRPFCIYGLSTRYRPKNVSTLSRPTDYPNA